MHDMPVSLHTAWHITCPYILQDTWVLSLSPTHSPTTQTCLQSTHTTPYYRLAGFPPQLHSLPLQTISTHQAYMHTLINKYLLTSTQKFTRITPPTPNPSTTTQSCKAHSQRYTYIQSLTHKHKETHNHSPPPPNTHTHTQTHWPWICWWRAPAWGRDPASHAEGPVSSGSSSAHHPPEKPCTGHNTIPSMLHLAAVSLVIPLIPTPRSGLQDAPFLPQPSSASLVLEATRKSFF